MTPRNFQFTGKNFRRFIFFWSIPFHSLLCMVCSLIYVFCFGYYVYRLVGVTAFCYYRFRNFVDFLLSSVFKSTDFCGVSFFWQLWCLEPRAEHLWLRLQLGALIYQHFRSYVFSSPVFFRIIRGMLVSVSVFCNPFLFYRYKCFRYGFFCLSYLFCFFLFDCSQ